MFVAQIRLAAVEMTESRAGILRLIGGDSLKPSDVWMEDKVEEQVPMHQLVQALSSLSSEGLRAHETTENETDSQDSSDANNATAVSDAEDIYERYRKMLKVGVPRQTVEERMRIDGVNNAGLDGACMTGALHRKQSFTPATIGMLPVTKTKRRRWHWIEVAEADRAPPPLEGSLWMQVNAKEAQQRLTAPSQAYIQELYVREIPHAMESSKRALLQSNARIAATMQRPSRPGNKMEKVQILKGNKAVNLELAVNRITSPFTDVAKDINILTAMYLQDTDVRTILAMWPSMAEEIALEEYSDDFEALKLSEQFLVTIRAVPMVKEKLECLLLKLELPSRAENLKQAAGLVTRALNQLCSSTKFTKVMQLLRDFGNLANEEFVENYRTRFSLESLTKMSHTKSFDNKSSMLDGFLHVLQLENDGTLSNFYDEINLVLQCKSVSVDGLIAEMTQLREGYKLVQAVALASSNASDESAQLAHQAFTQFADEVDDKLHGVQISLDTMNTSKHKFESWFEEDARAPLDQHLKAIVHFALAAKAKNAVLN
ncbi:unnamed protein product [Peronospora belbahrii]|uniref:FH2 domain-containing protein n=1 Tax=Peronospora belbahrii TaxID=622444 RepID=A0AAU9L7X0_9STRA|nr:unnamed protein product [Peronospora belbahrii]CAH0516917.1 unnamed protein product [Peronospora belbahrii]